MLLPHLHWLPFLLQGAVSLFPHTGDIMTHHWLVFWDSQSLLVLVTVPTPLSPGKPSAFVHSGCCNRPALILKLTTPRINKTLVARMGTLPGGQMRMSNRCKGTP